MFRGEIYAYPLYLQKELCTENATFFCADIMCKYWPYLIKVCQACPELRNLLNMKPFLSVMHAKVHGIKCEVFHTNVFILPLLNVMLYILIKTSCDTLFLTQ